MAACKARRQQLGSPAPQLVVPLAPFLPSGVFACFSAAALLSPRRQYLYLGGILSSVRRRGCPADRVQAVGAGRGKSPAGWLSACRQAQAQHAPHSQAPLPCGES